MATGIASDSYDTRLTSDRSSTSTATGLNELRSLTSHNVQLKCRRPSWADSAVISDAVSSVATISAPTLVFLEDGHILASISVSGLLVVLGVAVGKLDC